MEYRNGESKTPPASNLNRSRPTLFGVFPKMRPSRKLIGLDLAKTPVASEPDALGSPTLELVLTKKTYAHQSIHC